MKAHLFRPNHLKGLEGNLFTAAIANNSCQVKCQTVEEHVNEYIVQAH